MKILSKEALKFFGLIFLLLFYSGCKTLSPIKPQNIALDESFIESNDVKITYVPKKSDTIAYLMFEQKIHLVFGNLSAPIPFKKELILDHNMRNVAFSAKVKKDGRVLREFFAQDIHALASNRSLALAIPYVAAHEEIEISLSYEWVDTRWFMPIVLSDSTFSKNARLVLEVPHGVILHYQITQNNKPIDVPPTSIQIEKTLWAIDKEKTGVGTRYIFDHKDSTNLQIFLSFEPAFSLGTKDFFDSWYKVSSFLYNKIDRLDVPNDAIKDYTAELIKDIPHVLDKIRAICTFLKNEIKLNNTNVSFQYQDVQPASRTFIRKAGGPLDIVLLGKAMFIAADISADIIAVGNKDFNPKIVFFNPSLFHDVVLAIFTKEKTYYFDPNVKFDNLWQLDPNLQGQNALLLSSTKGYLFSLPYDGAEKHEKDFNAEIDLKTNAPSTGFFNSKFSGAFVEDIKREIDLEQNIIDPLKLERAILEGNDATIRFFEIQKEYSDDSSTLSFSGSFVPFSLASNEGKISFNIYPLLSPIAKLLLSEPDHSSITNVNITLRLPADYVIEDILGNLSYSDMGRFFNVAVNNLEGQVVIKANATINMPIGDSTPNKDVLSFLENLKKPLILKPLEQPGQEQKPEGPLFEDKDESGDKKDSL